MMRKWLKVPLSNETKEVQAVQMWEVRWHSRYGQYSGDTRPELECFPSQEEAESFAESLRNAFKLIRHSFGTWVAVQKAK